MHFRTAAFRATRWSLPVLVTIFLSVIIFGWAESRRNTDEEYEVYSAYLSGEILDDAHDWSVGPHIQVVIADHTAPGGSLRISALYMFDSRVQFDQMKTSTRASYILRNIFSAPVKSNFSLPKRATVALTSQSDFSTPEFQKKFPHNMGLLVLSGVGFDSSHTQAVFYVDHFCGLCGGGAYIFLQKIDGHWRPVDLHGTWIS